MYVWASMFVGNQPGLWAMARRHVVVVMGIGPAYNWPPGEDLVKSNGELPSSV